MPTGFADYVQAMRSYSGFRLSKRIRRHQAGDRSPGSTSPA